MNKTGLFTFKNMKSGEQQKVNMQELISILKA